MSHPSIGRRRVLKIAGAAAGLPLVTGWGPGDAPIAAPIAATGRLRRWYGRALGAEAAILLHGKDARETETLIRRCLAEIERLEAIFSLYRPGSSLSRLNRRGRLESPPSELVALMSESRSIGDLTGGVFDISVQPLWRLYAAHFARRGADPSGPGADMLGRALDLVDQTAIDIEPRSIAFARPGMAVTLNGIAQGYITDRIADLLRDHGIDDLFVDLGEVRASGGNPAGRNWRVGLVDPADPRRLARIEEIGDGAVASSGGYGTPFEPTGRHHHLFDRTSGTSAHHLLGVSVFAPRATMADGLSTALGVMPPERVRQILTRFAGVSAILTRHDGSAVTVPGARPDARPGGGKP